MELASHLTANADLKVEWVPPYFILESAEPRQRALNLAFAGPDDVNAVCNKVGAKVELVMERWPAWCQALINWLPADARITIGRSEMPK